MKKKMKNLFSKIMIKLRELLKLIKKIFSNKRNLLILIICLVIILGVVLTIAIKKDARRRFVLNHVYDVMPNEVRELYSNLVEVSCYGDLHFDLEVDKGRKELKDINKNILIDYMFSYLDKNDLLTNKLDEKIIRKAERDLFADRLNLFNEINNYGYGDYTYNNKNGKIVRSKRECNSDIKYVLHLYSYSYNENELSVTINVAYLKDGMLYNFNDEELGEYDGDVSKLFKLTKNTSYYKVYYVKRKGLYKLSSVEWKNRT